MNRIITSCILVSSFFIACEVVDLNESDPIQSINGSQPSSQIEAAPIMAADSNEVASILTGNNIKNWSTTRFTLSGSTRMTNCRIDDNMSFFKNGTFRYDGGDILCGAEDSRRIKNGRWAISFDSKTILFREDNGDEYTATIIGLNDKEIRLRGSYFKMEVKGVYTSN